jgi:hypothetical protein
MKNIEEYKDALLKALINSTDAELAELLQEEFYFNNENTPVNLNNLEETTDFNWIEAWGIQDKIEQVLFRLLLDKKRESFNIIKNHLSGYEISVPYYYLIQEIDPYEGMSEEEALESIEKTKKDITSNYILGENYEAFKCCIDNCGCFEVTELDFDELKNSVREIDGAIIIDFSRDKLGFEAEGEEICSRAEYGDCTTDLTKFSIKINF